jgi:tryptophan synthase alpha chain
MVDDFRKSNTQTPLVLMGYFNPIYQYGCEAFVKEAERVGVDGLIIVDLPPEEDEELRVHTQKAGIDLIRLITPVTDEHRLKTLVQSASGFLYYVSITGVTGTASADNSAVGEHIKEIKTYTDLPVAVGFGIKTPDDARSFAEVADGIVVGSALVAEFEIEPEQAGIRILNKVQALKAAL